MHSKNPRSAPSPGTSTASRNRSKVAHSTFLKPVTLIALLLLCLLSPTPAPASEPPEDRDPPAVEIGRPSGLEPPDQASMAAWHRRYAPLARPVKRALRDVLAARERVAPGRRVHHMGRPCRALGSALAEFKGAAARHRVFPVADSAVDIHLKRLYLRLGDIAEACAGGRWAETEEGLRQAGLAYRQAESTLGRWGLSP